MNKRAAVDFRNASDIRKSSTGPSMNGVELVSAEGLDLSGSFRRQGDEHRLSVVRVFGTASGII
jgi:hypothetical protein